MIITLTLGPGFKDEISVQVKVHVSKTAGQNCLRRGVVYLVWVVQGVKCTDFDFGGALLLL
jgi:hypothetical protein